MAKVYKWTYRVDADKCMTCASCELECRDDSIYVHDYLVYAINEETCTRCARCYNACPVEAIVRIPNEAAV